MRLQRDAERLQARSERNVIVLLSRESCEVVHNDEVDVTFACAAELQQLLQLRAAVGNFLVDESSRDT